MEASKESLLEDDHKDDGAGGDRSTASRIYRLIRDMFDKGKKGKKRRFVRKRFGRGPDRERDHDMDVEDADSEDEDEGTLSMVDVRARVLVAGFTEMDLMNTITEVNRFSPFSTRALVNAWLDSTVRGVGNSHASRKWYETSNNQQDLAVSLLPRPTGRLSCIAVPHFVPCFLRSCPRCCLPHRNIYIFTSIPAK